MASKITKRYTLGEEIFSSVTHGVGGLLSVAGTAVLIVGTVVGLGLAFYAMIKYNKGIF